MLISKHLRAAHVLAPALVDAAPLFAPLKPKVVDGAPGG
jgi:hypothetical protein